MKTEKYSIQFVSVDTDLSTEIFISKKEYKKQIDFLAKVAYETVNNEFPLEQFLATHDKEGFTIIRQRFTVGCGDVWLSSYTCKPGYKFK